MFNFLEVNNQGICCEQFIMLLYRKRCLHKGRSSRSHMFFKLSVLKNLQNFTGKHLRPATLLKKTPAPAPSCETFKRTFFYKTLPVAASGRGR